MTGSGLGNLFVKAGLDDRAGLDGLGALGGSGSFGISACGTSTLFLAVSLAISALTKLRNSELNCAPGCESLLAMYSIFPPSNFFEPIPPNVIHGFGLYISIIRPTLPLTAGFQLSIEGCSAIIRSTYLALLATNTELFAPRL